MNTSGVEALLDPPRVAALMEHPLRLAIVHAAAVPRSATEIAAGLGLPRQKINYHIGRLRRAGFLVPAERRKRRGFVEQRYTATAKAYVVDARALGPIAARPDLLRDRLSADYLIALASQVQSDLSEVVAHATRQGKRVATMSLSTELRFADPEQRARFAVELRRVITRLVARHAEPAQSAEGKARAGRLFRLVVGCYPPPATPAAKTD